MSEFIIKDLYIYPIKGCKGISVNEVKLHNEGFESDRRYMLIDEDNKFLTQRTIRSLPTLDIEIKQKDLLVSSSESFLKINHDPDNSKLIQASVWNHTVESYEVSEEANNWFSDHLGVNCKLVSMGPKSKRIKSLIKPPGKTLLSYADGYPYHIIGTGSIHLFNQKAGFDVNINRFRPNIVVETHRAHEEDAWDSLSIGNAQFKIIKKSPRCQVINVNQSTGEVDDRILKSITSYRREKNKVYFGVYAITSTPGVSIKTGDKIHCTYAES